MLLTPYCLRSFRGSTTSGRGVSLTSKKHGYSQLRFARSNNASQGNTATCNTKSLNCNSNITIHSNSNSSSSTSTGNEQTSKEKGDALEIRVQNLCKRMGKWNVKRDLTLKDKNGNISQIDVRYGIFFKTYIECKNYSSHPVPLSDVAKFKEVLTLNNIPYRNGLFITTSYYVPRATTIGIKTVDGKQLVRMEKRAIYVRFSRYLIYLLLLLGIVFTVLDYKSSNMGFKAWFKKRKRRAWRKARQLGKDFAKFLDNIL